MKVAKWVLGFTGGFFLFSCSMFALDVPADLPFWRWALGLLLMSASVVVWDKWAS